MNNALKISLIVGIPTLLLCGVGSWGASQYVDFPWASHELESTVAESRRLGLPWVASDLRPKPELTFEENAGPEIQRACQLVGQIKGSTNASNDATKALNEGDFAKAQDAVDLFAEPLAVIEKAVAKPKSYIERDYDLGPDLLLPEYAWEKSICKVLGVRSQIQASKGNVDASMADIRRMGRLTQLMESEPILIGMLVEIACESIRLRAVEALAGDWKDNPAALEKLDQTILATLPKTDIKFTLRGEVYMAVALCRNFEKFGGLNAVEMTSSGEQRKPVDPRDLDRTGYPKGLMARAFLTRALQFWNAFFATAKDGEDPLALTKRLDQLMKADASHTGLSYRINDILMPVFSQAGIACVRMVALQRCTDAFLKVMAYRAQHRSFPSTLADAGASLIDPFDGQPLRYRHNTDSCRVYSVGADGDDNGGVMRRELGRTTETPLKFDEAVCYPPVVDAKSTTRARVNP